MKRATLRYKTRDIGYGIEEDFTEVYLTNEIDVWGKRTILVDAGDGKFRAIYLFADEYEV